MQGSLVDRILDFFMPLFSYWGYAIVFGGVFLESLFLTGWIAPGTMVLLLAGFYAAHGELNPLMVTATAVVAALLGDLIGFFIGRRLGRGLISRYRDRPRVMLGLDRGQRYFRRYGGLTVILGRMLSGVDAFIPVTAGINRMSLGAYLGFDIPGIILWSALFTCLGYFLGTQWRTIDRIFDALGWGLLALLAMVAAAWYLARRRAERLTE
ncbi:DedA family protein [Candidatus Solincola sp.]|nr:DedA family protein [Actinomycetota bacterium]